MKICERPGCVAQVADDAPLCNVHKNIRAERCERCGGTGSYFYPGAGRTMAYQACGGTGLRDRSVRKQKSAAQEAVDKRGLIKIAERDALT